MVLFLILAYGVVCGVVSAVIVSAKDREPAGWFFIGFLFGVLGIIAALMAQPSKGWLPEARSTDLRTLGRSAERPQGTVTPSNGIAGRSQPGESIRPTLVLPGGKAVEIVDRKPPGWALIRIEEEPGEWWVEESRLERR